MKDKYNRIIERFEQYYPYLYEQSVDWWPSGRTCITVKLEDGMLFEYNHIDNTIRRIQSSDRIKDADLLRKEIGYNLKNLILTRGISQAEISERCGITPAMLSRYLHGTSMPGIDKVYALASILGCRTVDILGESYED